MKKMGEEGRGKFRQQLKKKVFIEEGRKQKKNKSFRTKIQWLIKNSSQPSSPPPGGGGRVQKGNKNFEWTFYNNSHKVMLLLQKKKFSPDTILLHEQEE